MINLPACQLTVHLRKSIPQECGKLCLEGQAYSPQHLRQTQHHGKSEAGLSYLVRPCLRQTESSIRNRGRNRPTEAGREGVSTSLAWRHMGAALTFLDLQQRQYTALSPRSSMSKAWTTLGLSFWI